jgi:diguanylate cyclase
MSEADFQNTDPSSRVLAAVDLTRTDQSILTLRYVSPALERAFDVEHTNWARQAAPATVIVAIFAYLAYGVLDIMLVSPEVSAKLWQVRAITVGLAIGALFVMFSKHFARVSSLVCFGVGVVGYLATGLLYYFTPNAAAAGAYVSVLLTIMFVYLLLGIKFREAMLISVIGMISYLAMFAYFKPPADNATRMAYTFFLVTVNAIAAYGAYNLERNRRQLFLREQRVQLAHFNASESSAKDPLTGLASRPALEQALSEIIELSDDTDFAFVAADLSGFRRINAKLGMAVGDALLQAAGAAIEQAMPNAHLVSRLGGDEFAVVLHGVGDEHALAAMERQIAEAVSSVSIDAAVIQGLPENLSAVTAGMRFTYPGCNTKDIFRRTYNLLSKNKLGGSVGGILESKKLGLAA